MEQTAKEKAEQAAQKAKETGREMADRGQSTVEQVFRVAERVPLPIYEGLAIGAALASAGLLIGRQKDAAVFTGLWAPTLLALGILNRLGKPSREMPT